MEDLDSRSSQGSGVNHMRAIFVGHSDDENELRARLENAGINVRIADSFDEATMLTQDSSSFDVTVLEVDLFKSVTARLAAAFEELQRQRTSVLHLSQLKNDLIAVLAHDIKGPLTSIVGFAELLEEGFLEGEQAVDAARTIRSNAQRLATLANDVLALSRVEHGELEISDERVDVIKLIQDIIDLHAAERTIQLDSDTDEAYVRGDAERLRQVFDNLLCNAIKYSPGGEPVLVQLRNENGSVITSIVDRGIGIPPDEVERMFDRFSRGSNARRAKISGTGIGLFIVKMILERHGGEIFVQSVLGEGSRFDVRLPSIDASDSLRPIRVTLLMGDKGLSRFSAYELRTRGYRVREAGSIEEVAHPELRAGDIVVAEDRIARPSTLREAIGADRAVRLVGVSDSQLADWDAALLKPFLITDLIHAIAAPADKLVQA
jgi:signal transduction histidine kinase